MLFYKWRHYPAAIQSQPIFSTFQPGTSALRPATEARRFDGIIIAEAAYSLHKRRISRRV
ncbi:MAG TPA: hypothetical protein H9982_04915 [Candidatus Barnesiella excrementipullorum]|uniref:Uncharacterized protein n=1 Tax=Candidatus Barnesiella excrementipullorum TaxID=2838479 RepID=A0A9D1VSF8_9BACT|nr:hypothetical protein [Candidatus Barnesiella excrementipullorum]